MAVAQVSKCKIFGANVVQHGQHIIEAKEFAMSAPQFQGMKYINGYDHPGALACFHLRTRGSHICSVSIKEWRGTGGGA
jgi:hypothetical protein